MPGFLHVPNIGPSPAFILMMRWVLEPLAAMRAVPASCQGRSAGSNREYVLRAVESLARMGKDLHLCCPRIHYANRNEDRMQTVPCGFSRSRCARTLSGMSLGGWAGTALARR